MNWSGAGARKVVKKVSFASAEFGCALIGEALGTLRGVYLSTDSEQDSNHWDATSGWAALADMNERSRTGGRGIPMHG